MDDVLTNIIVLDTRQQYDDLLKGLTVTLNSGAVLNGIDPNAEYVVPESRFYKYHIRLTASTVVGDVTYTYVAEFDIYSKSSNLFSTSNTVAVNWGIFHSLYANQRIPVAFQADGGPEYRLSGAVSLIIPTTATEDVIFEGGVLQLAPPSAYYVTDEATITGFEFTPIEQ